MYISVDVQMYERILVAKKENLTGVSTGLTGRSKNLDPTGKQTTVRLTRLVPVEYISDVVHLVQSLLFLQSIATC